MTPEFFEPDAAYKVRMTRDVPFGGMVLRTGQDVQLRGVYCAALAAEIESAEKIEE